MRILIGLIEHFGDVVACEPVARYLREKYRHAHLSWAIRAPFRELVDTNPNIDETLVLGCLTDWIKLRKHARYDRVVDLHVNYRVCEECRVPLIKEQGNPFVNAWEWFDYGAILEAFSQGAGLPKLSAHPQIYLQDKHTLAVDALQLPAQYCVIHRESNEPAKDWRDENWRRLVRFLTDELQLPVVEVGAKKRKSAHGITNTTGQADLSHVIDLRDRTSLLETAEVIRRARFFIGIDSGPAHLANAVKTPGIILLGRAWFFRQYTPFTGFYVSRSPRVRLLRNLTGPVAELPVDDVMEAAGYLARVLDEQQTRTGDQPPPVSVPFTCEDSNYRRMVSESGLFDRAWYLTQHPEAGQDGADPLDHFITAGVQSGYSPAADFDAAWYNKQRPDLKVVTDPLRHYLHFGRSEGARTRPEGSSVVETAPAVETIASVLDDFPIEPQFAGIPAQQSKSSPRIFAFYLPQFHPIAENNGGHRPGFTEWDNVINAKPLFKGHYQPRRPGELGYYDLRSVDVMREQVKLARDHGITGFCFYYYYFQGRKLLYKPIENYLKSDIEAPFFFLWANENWSRRWDGGDNEVIVAQNHSPEDDLVFIRELLPVFADPRYVKVAGRPILGVYKTHLFPDIRQTTERWRNEIVKHGFPDIYLVMVDDWTSDPPHPREFGFDASYEIPSNLTPDHVLAREIEPFGLQEGFEGRLVDYRKFASYHMGRPFPVYKRFRTVMAPWDNTPRYGSRAIIHVNTDNDAYKLWLSQALIDTYQRYAPDERIVFLHSWNEWCEGTYIEPDGRYGRLRLEETREVVNEFRSFLPLDSSAIGVKTALDLRRLMRQKDEGAARSLQAMRQQNMYLYRDLEHLRAQVADSMRDLERQRAAQAELEEAALERQRDAQTESQAAIERQASMQAELQEALAARRDAEALLDGILQSKSWRSTKPLRVLANRIGATR